MMFSKKQLLFASTILALIYHFVFYMNTYGPVKGLLNNMIYLIAYASILIIFFIYISTKWRVDFKDKISLRIHDLLIIWILVCFVRSMLQIGNGEEMRLYLLSNYMAISLFPVLFLLVGVNAKYFYSINRTLIIYMIIAGVLSMFFLNYFELQIFLLMPVFYVILTMPLRSVTGKLFIILITISIIAVSLSNRAGILRILISYSIVAAYYLMLYARMNKKLLIMIIFLILMLPPVALYLGTKGQSVFQMTLGDNETAYSQMDPYADTRTFLYYEVFQDMKSNNAFVFGKGLNAGYYSESFRTYSRPIVEVCFLQLLLKTGIVGVLLYLTVILIALFKALKRAQNLFIKSLGILLASYIIMMFIENQVAYNLLNVVIWIVVGMCHSEELLNMNNREIKQLFNIPYDRFKQKAVTG